MNDYPLESYRNDCQLFHPAHRLDGKDSSNDEIQFNIEVQLTQYWFNSMR